MSTYDFTDPLIREMVSEHHKPKEVISIRNSGFTQIWEINCRQCGQPWPCPARKALLEWSKKEGEKPPRPFPGMGTHG